MLTYVFAVAIACFCLEKLVPGWRLPSVRTWPIRVVLVNLVQLGVVLLAGVTWERWLAGSRHGRCSSSRSTCRRSLAA